MSLIRRNSQSFHFPYKRVKTPIGTLDYAYVKLEVLVNNSWVKKDFLVDTGADITTMPRYMSSEFGVDLNSLNTDSSIGVGEGSVKTWETKIVRFFDKQSLSLLDKFNLYFDNSHSKLILSKK